MEGHMVAYGRAQGGGCKGTGWRIWKGTGWQMGEQWELVKTQRQTAAAKNDYLRMLAAAHIGT